MGPPFAFLLASQGPPMESAALPWTSCCRDTCRCCLGFAEEMPMWRVAVDTEQLRAGAC